MWPQWNWFKYWQAHVVSHIILAYDAPYWGKTWEKVNNWIRTSCKFDAEIDFAKIIAIKEDVNLIQSDLHYRDHLHPNEKYYRKMVEAINLNLFTK